MIELYTPMYLIKEAFKLNILSEENMVLDKQQLL